MKTMWCVSLIGRLMLVMISGILLAFVLGRMLPAGDQVTFLFGERNIRSLYVFDVQYHIAAQLARGTNPYPYTSWSPDGKQLAYVAFTQNHTEIFRLDVECASLLTVCGTPIPLTTPGDSGNGPAWSPDGSSILFANYRNGPPDIFWIPAAGGKAYNLTQNSTEDNFPVWSPDGHYMAYYSERGGSFEVYVMNMDCLHDIQTCPQAVHYLGGGFNSLPAWSPDSQQLAYFNYGDLFLVQTACLAVSDECDSQAYNLTRSSFTDWYPIWSPDGQRLIFQSNRRSPSQIYEAPVNCDSIAHDCATPLKSALSYSLYPSFSPDGSQVMLLLGQSDAQELYLVAADGSSVQQLTHMGGQISSARWRPVPP